MADTIVAWSTPAALNRAAEFWREQEILKNRRMSDEAILQIAVMDVNSEESRMEYHPLGRQMVHQ
jgi:hypothetical protein